MSRSSGDPTHLGACTSSAQEMLGRAQRRVPAVEGRVIGKQMPLALGYVRRYPWMSDREYGVLQQRLAEAARQAGYTLGTVHAEDLPTDPQAFEILLASTRDLNVRAVIIPTKAHLGRWDRIGSKYEQLRRTTSAEIIVIDASP
jgi:hypothetical protein